MTYRGEVCEDCGFPVSFFVRSYWNAPDALWDEVMDYDIILCPPCFTDRAKAKGISVHWLAHEEEKT